MQDPQDKQGRPLLALGALAVVAAGALLFTGFALFSQGAANAEAKELPLSHFIPPRQQLAALEIEPVRLEMFGEGPGRPIPAIPLKAVMYAGDVAQVWVAGNDGSLALRDVSLGAIAGEEVEVTRGLATGEKIVTNGTLFADRALVGQ